MFVPGRPSLVLSVTISIVISAFAHPGYRPARSSLRQETPQGLNVWTSVGPVLQQARAIAVDPSDPGTVYAGVGFETGVSKSTDLGQTWHAINAGLLGASSEAPTVTALSISPLDDSTLYAGTVGVGVFRSTNGGATWLAVNEGLPGFAGSINIDSVLVSPVQPAVAFVGLSLLPDTPDIFRTSDSGVTWQPTNITPDLSVFTFAADPAIPDTIYAGTSEGIYRSSDGGMNWVAANKGIPTKFGTVTNVPALAIDPTNPSFLYAGLSSGAGVGAFRSSDGGDSWAPIDIGLTDTSVNALAISPVDSSTIYAGTTSGGVFQSTDGGGTWGAINQGLTGSIDRQVVKLAATNQLPVTLFAGTALVGMFAMTLSVATPVPNYTGFVDGAGCGSIAGWAADRNRPNVSIDVEVYDGTTLLTTVLADASRPDVGAYLGDNGLHGFSIPTPAALKNGAAHTVHLKFETSATDLSGSPFSLTCTTSQTPNYIGFVDSATCTTIAGWAADKNNLNTSINVELYDGTNLIGIVPATLSRPDVGAFLGDNGLHGFSIPTPDGLKTGTAHSLHVRFATSSTELSGSPAPITCAAATPTYIGFVDGANCTSIAGWAADRHRLNSPITVEVYDGATLLLTVVANLNRPDVATFLGDNGNHGFNIATPASVKSGTAHSIHVKFETSATDLSGSPLTLTCAGLGVEAKPLVRRAIRTSSPSAPARGIFIP
jgi:photosystem II stability/assembly factor-like uncharacterized protein